MSSIIMLVILVIFEFIMLITDYKKNEKSIISISFFTTLLFFISTIAMIYSYNKWNINFHFYTFITIFVGLILISIAECLVKKIKIKQITNISIIKNININSYIFIFTCFFLSLFVFLYFYNVLAVGKAGFASFAIVKNMYSINPSGNYINLFIRQSFKIVIGFSYFFCYIFANNFLASGNFKKNIKYLYPIFLGVIITIISGSRSDILKIFSALLFDYHMLKEIYSVKEKSVINKKNILLLILSVFMMAFLLYGSRNVVKITNTKTSSINNIFDYVSFYIGSPVAVLNNKIIYKYSDGNYLLGNRIKVSNFVYLGKLDYGGNVGTIFGITLFKYNAIIMFSYIFLLYFLIAYIIKKSKNCKYMKKGISLPILLASYLYQIIMFSFYDDLFIQFFTLTNILTIFMIIIIYFMFIYIKDFIIIMEEKNEI